MTIVRLFNTVGPRQVGMYGMVLPRFVEAALKGEPLHVYGDGRQTRCFCHVSDVVDALVKLTQTPAAFGQVFNLGGVDEVSMNDLAAKVISISGSASHVEHLSYEAAYGQKFDDMLRRVPSVEKIKATIGFSPRFTLEEIVRAVLAERAGTMRI